MRACKVYKSLHRNVLQCWDRVCPLAGCPMTQWGRLKPPLKNCPLRANQNYIPYISICLSASPIISNVTAFPSNNDAYLWSIENRLATVPNKILMQTSLYLQQTNEGRVQKQKKKSEFTKLQPNCIKIYTDETIIFKGLLLQLI